MAIQFNCPYCTVTIQVPDHAAGKKGTCPQCGTKIVVPIPKNAPPEASAPPAFVPSQGVPNFAPNFTAPPGPNFVPQPSPMMAAPGYPNVPGMPVSFDPAQPMTAPPGYAVPPGYFPAPSFVTQTTTQIPDEPPSLTMKAKKKRTQRSGSLLWGSLAAIVMIGAVLAFVFLKPGAKSDPLSGKLTATRIPNGKLQPAIVHRDWLTGLDEETVTAVLKQMEKRTVTLRSDLVILKFQGAAEGIKITATPGPSAELVSVDVASQKGLSNWASRHASKLGDQHQKQVIRAAKTFIKQWAEAEARGEKKMDFSRFHDELGVAALTAGLGAEAVAIVGHTLHNCIAEQDGQLFFLLPPGTDQFELQGREHDKGNFVFPGHFVVEVESAVPVLKPSSKKKDEDAEMADEGDPESEMKTKSFGKPALNDPSATNESMPEDPSDKPKSKKKKSKNDN